EALRQQEERRLRAGRIALEQLDADAGRPGDGGRVDVDMRGERAAAECGVDEGGRVLQTVRAGIGIARIIRGRSVAGEVDGHPAVAADGVAEDDVARARTVEGNAFGRRRDDV